MNIELTLLTEIVEKNSCPECKDGLGEDDAEITKVVIKQTQKGKGDLIFSFHSNDDLNRILELIERR